MNKQPFRLVLGVGTGDLYMEMFYNEQTMFYNEQTTI